MFRIPLADAAVIVVLSALVVAIVPAMHPPLTGDTFTVTVGKIPPDVAETIPPPTFPVNVRPGKGPNQLIVNSPSAGVFTVTGAAIDKIGSPRSMQLWVNDHPVTFSMLGGGVQEYDAEQLRPIARHVRLRAGENVLIFRQRFLQIPVILRMQREAPTPWWLSAVAGVATLATLWSLSILSRRWFTQGFRVPAAAVAGTLLLTGAALAWIGLESGAELIRAGETAPTLESGLRRLDDSLANISKNGPRATSVAVFGDSTQMNPALEFKDALATVLERDHPGQFDVYGLAHSALTGRAYYLLLNKVIREHPDILVLPINLLNCEDRWYDDQRWHFPTLERFLRFEEFPRATGLRVGRFKFRWERLVFYKADAAWFDRRIDRFVKGLQLHVSRETRRLGVILNEQQATVSPDDEGGLTDAPARLWALDPEALARTVTVEPDNDLLNVFRAINALTRKHGIRVIYYATPVRSDEKEARGVYLQPEKNFDTIERALSGPAHVTFLRPEKTFPQNLFLDATVHLKPGGIQYLADVVAKTVATTAGEASGQTPPPGPR